MAQTALTTELNADFLGTELQEDQNEENALKSSAASRAAAGGQAGVLGSSLAEAQYAGDQLQLGSLANFGVNVAGENRSERLTEQNQAFQSAEARKNRDFREKMAQMGYMWQGNQQANEQRAETVAGQQGLAIGAPFGLAEAAIKGWGLGAEDEGLVEENADIM